jgi:hypothetical protein
MKRRNKLSISALVLLLLACSASQQRLEQCKEVVRTYLPLETFSSEQWLRDEQFWRADLVFSVRSALGPQPAKASCEYAVTSDGEAAARPYAIVLGSTRHIGDANIDDLLRGRYAEGLPAHVGH